MSRLRLAPPLYRRLIEEARATPQVEVCGFLAGRGDTCTAVYPGKNISPTPACAYYMDPHTQIAAMAAMRECGETMLGIYHSHPTTPAEPSPRDLAEAAYPGAAYVIISLCDEASPEVAAFAFARGAFAPMCLVVESVL